MQHSSLIQIAQNCPDYNPVTSAQGCSLPPHLQYMNQVSCRYCIYWEDKNCSTFQAQQN